MVKHSSFQFVAVMYFLVAGLPTTNKHQKEEGGVCMTLLYAFFEQRDSEGCRTPRHQPLFGEHVNQMQWLWMQI